MDKKNICISENELRQIVKDSICEILNINEKNGFINSLIKPSYIVEDFRGIQHVPSFDNPLTIYMYQNNINEGLMLTYPIDKTIEYISHYFKLAPSQINKVKGQHHIEKIAVTFFNVYDNVKIMSKAMDICGYYLGSPKESDIKKNEWVTLFFEPKIQNDDSIDIRSKENELIHITPFYNFNKIKQIGFSPRSKNDMFNYPDRVYFVKGSVSEEYVKGLAFDLFKANKSKGNNGKYVIITVDLSKISESVKFYYDPNYVYGVYTRGNIPPNCISNVEEIDFSKYL